MKLAFTAPMKPLDDPTPSGDRTLARLIVRALEQGGHEVEVPTRFRSWRKNGGVAMQQALKDEALCEAEAIAARWRSTGYKPDAFLTYHLYHKAPDWIGPALSEEFGCPYLVIEASRAPKQATGEWSFGFAEADKALSAADQVVALHRADAQCLRDVVCDKLTIIPPFIDADPFLGAPPVALRENGKLKLLAVGMMRPGAKVQSYAVLAQALRLLRAENWSLTIVGDGPEFHEVREMFSGLPVTFLGPKVGDDIPQVYADHDVLVWPAIREAFGFVFLEAQASGRPVIGGDTFGVPDIVEDGKTGFLSPEGDVSAMAANIERILERPELAPQMGSAARAHILNRHSLAAGTQNLNMLLARAREIFKEKNTRKT
ncbi:MULTISPECIES: glycosyltransferase family 4 protein [Pseudovibrio]|uniref:glycosyltransferase family 4 protein n=1 Tax=Stappiaceae TaxID=2821832 RepID=UPI0023664CDE|nr:MULTISPECIES: glycosyltransferase family 4 protein [Pseudovibrio]MDD7909109.1 glycosyltransferase family 4 protein [Pseudovibrio exalbescens]MDX5593569.1 glycosyltransferase family 4 protein [Pseudovibrio sp. SPO723]